MFRAAYTLSITLTCARLLRPMSLHFLLSLWVRSVPRSWRLCHGSSRRLYVLASRSGLVLTMSMSTTLQPYPGEVSLYSPSTLPSILISLCLVCYITACLVSISCFIIIWSVIKVLYLQLSSFVDYCEQKSKISESVYFCSYVVQIIRRWHAKPN